MPEIDTPFEIPCPEFISVEEGYVRLSLDIECSLWDAAGHIDKAIKFARSIGVRRLLANVWNVTGFEAPNLVERFTIVEQWAASAGGQVKMAMVIRPDLQDPQRIGVTIARNRFFVADAFGDEQAALAWLFS